MSVLNIEVQGFEAVKKLFNDIENQLSASQLRGILDEQGKVIITEAKASTQFTGIIAEDFKKDLGVYRDRKSSKNAEYILVGPRFKPYSIRGKEQKVAVIAQHMTEGFRQTDRSGHGRVKDTKENPVLEAFSKTKTEQNAGINKGVVKQMNKIKAKNSGVVK